MNSAHFNGIIDLLTTMYHDNVRTIHSLTDTIHNITESNNQIRSILNELIHSRRPTTHNLRRRDIRVVRPQQSNTTRLLERMFPYTIDFTIPTQNIDQLQDLLSEHLGQLLQPVEVYPTQSQIETATRRVRYSDIARPINTQCPISLDEFNDNDTVMVIRECGHTFYPDHLMNWFRTNCRCPVCRYDIREYRSTIDPTRIERQANQPISRTNSIGNNHFIDPSGNYYLNNNNNNNNSEIQLATEILSSLLRRYTSD